MPRRNPGTESAIGVRVARERLAATRWAARSAEGAADPGESADPGREPSDSAGLLELQVPAPGSPVPVRAADAVLAAGRRVGGGTSHHADETRGYRRAGRQALAMRFRARTGVKAAALLGVLAVVLGGCFWWQAGTGGSQVVALSDSAPAAEEAPDPADGGSTAPPGDDATAEPESIEVHVAGAVASPGVVQLPAGSRLHEAIAAAGGPTVLGDPDRLNLAAVLEDGQKVLVPIRGEPGQADAPMDGSPAPGSGTGGTGPVGGGGKVNLNTAGLEELGTLPRVGPVLAQRIVDWRQQHGRFKTVQELDAVDGIGPKLLEALLPLVGI